MRRSIEFVGGMSPVILETGVPTSSQTKPLGTVDLCGISGLGRLSDGLGSGIPLGGWGGLKSYEVTLR